ncbi:unnamed protein product [Gadus morhua 'NCC']
MSGRKWAGSSSCVDALEALNHHTMIKQSPRLSAQSATAPAPPPKKGRKKWTPFLDEVLTKAVRKHGEGNWKHMLLDHDYNGCMGVMLKDRWRILKRDTVA